MKPQRRILMLAACMAVSSALPGGAMSADSSGYAIVLPFVVNAAVFGTQTRVFVENHGSSPVELYAYYVGERQSANPVWLKCSDGSPNPVPQTFSLIVPADGVLQLDLRALLEQKCKGSKPAGTLGDRGTLTIFTLKGGEATRISALARIERVPGAGTVPLGFSEPGLPLGALEGSTQIISGARNGLVGASKFRTDCLISSLFDGGGSGNLYRVTVKDAAGSVLGSTVIALNPWTAELLVDVFSVVGASGAAIDGAMVEVEPAANPTNPSMVAACRVIGPTTTYHMGKVFEPKDLLRRRLVTASSTPGWGDFVFNPGLPRQLHAVFLRHPDLVECTVNSPQLAIEVEAPDGTFIAGGFQSTGEFDTRPRGAINHGVADAWVLKVGANQANPPTAPVRYTLSCVSGNGMSQLDKLTR